MWRWLDPVECRIAEQCLVRGHVLEAGRKLLACRDPDHKSVRDLLLRIGPQLVVQAQQAYETGDLLVASELIDCAARCCELPPVPCTNASSATGTGVRTPMIGESGDCRWQTPGLAKAGCVRRWG